MRIVLLFGVFACTALAFWWHFERRMLALNEVHIQDPGRILSPDERRSLARTRAALRADLGVDALARVDTESLVVPVFPAPTIFVGAGLARGEALIVLPPLVRRALGEGPRLTAEENLRRCLKSLSAGQCLQRALEELRAGLTGTGGLDPP